jgi:hypothetical protein
MVMKKNILHCPKCEDSLSVSKLQRYETLVEHVMDPNQAPSLKPTFRCTNKCYPRRIFWDKSGDVYIPASFLQKIFYKFNIYLKSPKVPNAVVIELYEEEYENK